MDLVELNQRFGSAEKEKDSAFFEECLSDDLVFRRASGTLNSKTEFLTGLSNPALIYHDIKTEVITVNELGEKAAVKAFVTVDMTKDGLHIQGSFANYRFFEKKGETWKLITWYNEKV